MVEWDGRGRHDRSGVTAGPDGVNARTTWLATVNDDGSPHVTAVGAIWLEERSGSRPAPRTLKSRNIVRDPRCSVSISVRGTDVVLRVRRRG